jgi:S1-C subfamily serine protease
LNEIVTSLIKTGREAQPYIGAVFNLDERKLRRANIPKGVLVTGVRPGSPAASASLRGGELIVKVNGQEIVGLADFERILNKVKVGDILVFTIRRGNGETDMTIKVEGI